MFQPEPTQLPVSMAADLKERNTADQWLIKDLWARTGVGILGGAPKCCKSWLGLDMAVSVASGSACLGALEVHDEGPALVYMAEDSLDVVKSRLTGICEHRGIDLRRIPLHVITAPTLRLDVERDQKLLAATVSAIKPRFLLLDPFVRLHRIDENNAGSVAAILGYLRGLQREHAMAIMLTHHARKNGSAGVQTGQGLRGSGDLHAWGDSNLYIRRSEKLLTLTIEHRAAPEPEALTLELVGDENPHLELAGAGARRPEKSRQAPNGNTGGLSDQILAALAQGPLSSRALRMEVGGRYDPLRTTLSDLRSRGRVRRDGERWVRVPDGVSGFPFP